MTRKEAIKQWSDEEVVESYAVNRALMKTSRQHGSVDQEHAEYTKCVECRNELKRRGKEHLLDKFKKA
jgi:hypothetical protein